MTTTASSSPSPLGRVSSIVLPSSSSTPLDDHRDNDGEVEEVGVGAETVLLEDDGGGPPANDDDDVPPSSSFDGMTSSSTMSSWGGGGDGVLVGGDDGTRPSPSLRGGYALRKFLSTPYRRNDNNENYHHRIDGVSSSVRGTASSTSRSLRRTPSYDPAAPKLPSSESSSSLFQNLLVDDDEIIDGDEGDGRMAGEGRGVEASLISPLFHARDGHKLSTPSRGRSSSYTSKTSILESPVPLKRVPISLRRKKSELSTKKNGRVHDDDDDLSTVAESVDPSSSSAISDEIHDYNDDMKKRKIGPSRRRRIVACTLVLVVSCAAIAVAISRVGAGTREQTNEAVGMNDASSSSNSHVEELALIEGGSGSKSGEVESDGVQPFVDQPNGGDEAYNDDDDVGGGGAGQNGEVDQPKPTNIGNGWENENVDPITTESSKDDDDGEMGQGENYNDEITDTTTTTTTTTTTSTPEETVTIFYAMADCPYSSEEREYLMPAHIDGIGEDAEFLVHLGDLQYAQEDYCEEWAYQAASGILMKCRVPTFVLPGDNDINDCEDIEHGKEMWAKYFGRIDEYWDHDFDVTRWGDLDESFSFLRKGVLYLGLNIPGGTPYSSDDAKERFDDHLERIDSILDGLSNDEYKVIVLLGHVDPSYGDAGDSHEFFEEFAQIVKKIGKPTVHIHGDYHEYYETNGGGYDIDNYLRISLDGESIAPPIRVEIDVSKENPIKVSRRRSGLSVDCCSDGWPNSEEL
ncbi:hypothetical protein ACHAXA_004802 [Cyclostephanos tholiformis]|uniref:Calcineurin-like phosphoesterase domain-containing protein n=1 Tax=Cyclostephanos tholiformis TaxID=382380 RepID=A0ABD3RWL6_9STRA